LARPAEKERVLQSMLGYLQAQAQAWDVLDLEALAGDSNITFSLSGAFGHYHVVQELPCPYTLLPPTWEEFAQGHLTSSHRWEIRNRRRRLERDHPSQVGFTRVRDAADLPAAFDALAALHQKRWHGKGQGSSFDHESFRGFHRELAALALERDWLRLYLIKVGTQVIAVEYAFLYRGTLFGYATAFDPAWGDYSPGQLLMAFVVEDAIGEGVRELDLGRGTFDYKFRWADRQRIDRHVLLSASPTGHLWAYGGTWLRRGKTLAREKLPSDLRERANHWLAGRKASPSVSPKQAAGQVAGGEAEAVHVDHPGGR
jgi:CelD/BcsL family acetyltransferase involved in cellulose biosynthesis